MKKEKKVMDTVLAVIAVVLILFTIAMIITFWHIGSVPDILITAVFGACLGEFGFMAWIKNVKEKCSNERYDDPIDGMCDSDWTGDGSNQENAGRPEV